MGTWSSKSTTNQRGEKIIDGTAEVQPPAVYVFTGQGSQEAGMGMDAAKVQASRLRTNTHVEEMTCRLVHLDHSMRRSALTGSGGTWDNTVRNHQRVGLHRLVYGIDIFSAATENLGLRGRGHGLHVAPLGDVCACIGI